ncbi:peptide ABC transporter substrate-binding protein [Fundicoccus ignavus]|uniref:Peptide ABC transporter substrate-binding protein n=1 Tax=Fundicoccus ignavus TaxID=2664442 RepID=A0A844C751_9LACT|nr:peptide ABC transporter substrate-binding protein [Fundicoccus ignavus]MRJ46317.1 peptide ABC transporter substrate-binding protein [Fundicoccus ignavus]
MLTDPVLDPALTTDTYSPFLLKNIFEGLTWIDSEGVTQPAMDSSWQVSEDSLVYTFTLREGAEWSNGDPVTAHDFEFAWKRVLNPETLAYEADELFILAGAEAYYLGEGSAEEVGVKALDDNQLEVTLKLPVPYFLELTSRLGKLLPVHQASVEANSAWAQEGGDSFVSNGPFTVSEINHNSHYVLAHNEHYWDQENVALETVTIYIVESEATANTMFQAHELDFIGIPFNSVSLDAIDLYREQDLFNVVDFAAIYNYKMNTTDETLSNVNIRMALALAVDRQTLIDNVTKGEETPALGFVPPMMKGFEEDRGYFKDADFESAREYLAKGMEDLGLTDPSQVSVTLSTNTSESHSAIAQFIQHGWVENLGISVEVANTEWQVHLDQLSTLNYQLGRMGDTGEYNDAYTFLTKFEEVDNADNRTAWHNDTYTDLLTKSRTENDSAKRVALLQEAEALLMESVPFVPVYYYSNSYAFHDNVKNMAPNSFIEVNLKEVEMK